jgi:hypothetical protein
MISRTESVDLMVVPPSGFGMKSSADSAGCVPTDAIFPVAPIPSANPHLMRAPEGLPIHPLTLEIAEIGNPLRMRDNPPSCAPP